MPQRRPLGAGDSTHLGAYRLTAVLGEGGQGSVYLAQAPDGQQVAIKVLHARLTTHPAERRRFRREAEIVSSGGHADRAGCHPPGRDHPPRFQAQQCDHGAGRADSRRFRHRPPGRAPHDPLRDCRHPGLPGPRAAGQPVGQPCLGRVRLGRHDGVRGNRAPGLPRRPCRRGDGRHPHAGAGPGRPARVAASTAAAHPSRFPRPSRCPTCQGPAPARGAGSPAGASAGGDPDRDPPAVGSNG